MLLIVAFRALGGSEFIFFRLTMPFPLKLNIAMGHAGLRGPYSNAFLDDFNPAMFCREGNG